MANFMNYKVGLGFLWKRRGKRRLNVWEPDCKVVDIKPKVLRSVF